MELASRIKQYRTERGWSQEELAGRAYVSRQTVSNWENEKSYPDVHSLLLLSDIFGVTLDELIKGDVEAMSEKIKSDEARVYKRVQYAALFGLLGMMIGGTLLYELVNPVAGGVFLGAMAVCVFMLFHKTEQIKKENDVQTYREVLAFMNGETLDEIEKQKELEKRGRLRRVEIFAAVQAIVILLAAAGIALWRMVVS